jgi:hypothetical protein
MAYLYFGKGNVSIAVTPSNSTISINKAIYTNTAITNLILQPGTYTIKVSSPGYKTIEDSVVISWRDSISKTYKLRLKSFEQIYNETPNPYDLTGREVVQEKFFVNNTWAAAYLTADEDSEDPGDVIVVVMQKTNNTWRVILYSDELPEDAQQKLPAEVYEYIKPFGDTNE